MSTANLETDGKGNVILHPVAGWTALSAHGMALMTRIEYFPSAEALAHGKTEGVQLLWTPQQCREFAQLLLKTADQLSQPPQTGGSH